jgi:hypothetical protein
VDMAKNSGDVILRDRMQFDLNVTGNRTTLYGRIDLSAYVNPVERQGLAVKQMFFQLRSPNALDTYTGVFDPVANSIGTNFETDKVASLKMWLSTRAYEDAKDVGIASPDVLCVYERSSIAGNTVFDAGSAITSAALINEDHWYGPEDLHPSGYTVVSDLLVGIAAEAWLSEADTTIELDVVLIAEPIKVTTERMNEILSQAQDL